MKTIIRFKKLILPAALLGMIFLFQACGPAYVETEPTYVETARPASPSTFHIWVEGDWVWSRSTRTYVRQDGHWERPSQNRVFVPGHWERTPRGHYWIAGHWERQGRH